jgi:hypothetical protein
MLALGTVCVVAPVSKCWKDLYATVESHQLRVLIKEICADIDITCVPQMTLCSSVFASPSRVKLACESGLDCSSEAYQHAAGKYANIATLVTAHDMGMQYTTETMLGAAQRDKLAEVQHLRSEGCPWAWGHLEEAASNGHFELLRWCYEHGCHFEEPWDAPAFAAQSGNIELVTWVLQLEQQVNAPLLEDTMCAAALRGHTAMCEFLRAQQCPWDRSVSRAAAVRGHLDCLRWLLDNGCPWEARQLCMSAAEGGSVEVCAWSQQQGILASTSMLTDMLNKAAEYNHLAAVQWLRAQGAEWPTAIQLRS